MKQCLRKKCQKEFEPNKPKQVFCSAKCRVYFSREEKALSVKQESPMLDVDDSVKSSKAGDKIIAEMVQKWKSEEIPRLKGEKSIDYRLRVLELSKKGK